MKVFDFILRPAVLIAGGFLNLLPLWSQPFSHDEEACLMAFHLKQAKSAVVSICTFAYDGNELLSRIGSGWIYGDDGVVVTRQSVVQGGDSIEITFYNGHRSPACVLDCDPVSQVALLKTDPRIRSGFSGPAPPALKQGDCVILLGNSLGVFPSVTLGHIITFKSNGYYLFDGSVPPGNSGGPIFNREGQLVGMLAGRIHSDFQKEPVGVAVPYENIQPVLERFFSFARKKLGWMGLYVSNLESSERTGVRVVGVIPDSPADRATIVHGDTLVALDGDPILSAEALARRIQSLSPNEKVTFDILRCNLIEPCVVEVGRIPFKQ
jgi:serine protease Do